MSEVSNPCEFCGASRNSPDSCCRECERCPHGMRSPCPDCDGYLFAQTMPGNYRECAACGGAIYQDRNNVWLHASTFYHDHNAQPEEL